MGKINYEDFIKLDIRTGKIIKAEHFNKANRPAYKLWIDLGELGVRKSSAQITQRYSVDNLLGRLVVVVNNLPPRQIADFMSEVLVLGVVLDNNQVVLLQPDRNVPTGRRIL